MKIVQLFIFLLLLILLSCNFDKNSTRSAQRIPSRKPKVSAPIIDSASIYDAQDLQVLFMNDTVNLDILRGLVKNRKCLDIPVDFESVTRGGVGRRGGLLHTLTSLISSEHTYSLTSLQAALFFSPKNKFEVLSILLESGADPNIITVDSISTLDWANIRDLDLSYCDTLIRYGAKPSTADLWQCEFDIERIEFFIERGGDPRTISWSVFLNTHPSHLPEYKNGNWKKNFLKVLSYGANPQKIDPLEINSFLRSNYHFDPEIMDSLMAYGLDLNEPLEYLREKTRREQYEYWLDYVIDNRYSEKLLRYIIEKGAKKTREGYDIYETAKMKRYSEEVLEFLESKFGK